MALFKVVIASRWSLSVFAQTNKQSINQASKQTNKERKRKKRSPKMSLKYFETGTLLDSVDVEAEIDKNLGRNEVPTRSRDGGGRASVGVDVMDGGRAEVLAPGLFNENVEQSRYDVVDRRTIGNDQIDRTLVSSPVTELEKFPS
jgi:hypothetical protein